VLTSYKLTESTDMKFVQKYSSSIYYFIGSGLNLFFYWLFGNAINYNTSVETKNVNQLAFPILGFNFPKTSTDKASGFVRKVLEHLLGTISTKIFINGFANNNSPDSVLTGTSIFNVILTGLKFMLIVPLGKKYNKWYEYIVDEKNNKFVRYLLRVLYTGLDIRKSENKLAKNIETGIVDKNLFFEGNDTVIFMILYFLLGSGISTFCSMDYFTNVPLISFILTCCKYISVIIIMIFYFKNKDSIVKVNNNL